MGRARKPLADQKGNLMQETQETMERIEAAVTGKKERLYKPPSFLIDARAKREYTRLVGLLDEINIIGDIDINNVAMYCNAFSKYCDATKQLAKADLILENGGENPLVNTQRKYAEECRKFAAACGLTLDSRLKAGQAKVDKQNDEIREWFGDI